MDSKKVKSVAKKIIYLNNKNNNNTASNSQVAQRTLWKTKVYFNQSNIRSWWREKPLHKNICNANKKCRNINKMALSPTQKLYEGNDKKILPWIISLAVSYFAAGCETTANTVTIAVKRVFYISKNCQVVYTTIWEQGDSLVTGSHFLLFPIWIYRKAWKLFDTAAARRLYP